MSHQKRSYYAMVLAIRETKSSIDKLNIQIEKNDKDETIKKEIENDYTELLSKLSETWKEEYSEFHDYLKNLATNRFNPKPIKKEGVL